MLSNLLVERTIGIIRAGAAAGAAFVLEHSADRADKTEHAIFLTSDHGSIWRYTAVVELIRDLGGACCTFAQCMLGGESQKYTTLLYSPALSTSLAPIDSLRCLLFTASTAPGQGGQKLTTAAGARGHQPRTHRA